MVARNLSSDSQAVAKRTAIAAPPPHGLPSQAVLSEELFLSAANDGDVRMWTAEGDLLSVTRVSSVRWYCTCTVQCVHTFSPPAQSPGSVSVSPSSVSPALQQYLYSVAALSVNQYVTCGEDSQVKVRTRAPLTQGERAKV